MTFFDSCDIRVYNLKINEMKKVLFAAIILAAFATGCEKDIFEDADIRKSFNAKGDSVETMTGSEMIRIQLPKGFPESPGNGIVRETDQFRVSKEMKKIETTSTEEKVSANNLINSNLHPAITDF